MLDEDGDFARRCNPEMVQLDTLEDPEEIDAVQALIERHARLHRQRRAAAQVLADWDELRAASSSR